MFHRVTDSHAESEQNRLCHPKEKCAKQYVSQWPPVVQRPNHQHQLWNHVDNNADKRPQNVDDPQRNWLAETEPREAFESRNREEERHPKHSQACQSQELNMNFRVENKRY